MKRHIQVSLSMALVAGLMAVSSRHLPTAAATTNFIDFGPVLSPRSCVTHLLLAPDGKIYGADYGTWQLFVFDPADKSIVSKGTPPEQMGALALTWGPDGLIYGGGWRSTLWTFDPNTDSFSNKGQVPGGRRILALTTGHDGMIYIGTEPGEHGPATLGRLFSFDPASQIFSDLGTVEGERSVGNGLITGPDGRVYGGTGPHGHLFAYDPSDGSITDKGQPIPSSYVRTLVLADDGRIYGGTQGPAHLFSFDPVAGLVSDLGAPVEGQGRVQTLVATRHKIYGGTGNCAYSGQSAHVFEYSLHAQEIADLGIPVQGEPVIGALVATARSIIYGGTAYSGHLFQYHPAPELFINFVTGAPGSHFTFTGLDFAPHDTAILAVNGRALGTVPTGADGDFSFLVSTDNADEGTYYVVAAADRRATASFVLESSEPTRPQQGSGPVFAIPAGIALTEFVYLPIMLH
jgi:hypothetical protein